MNPEPPGAQAWHEAGHALVAHLLGGRVRTVTLETDEEGLAGTATIEWLGGTRDERLAASACTALGGPLAELAFRGEHDADPEQLAAWAADWREVERCAAALFASPAEREQGIRAWFATTRELLDSDEAYERLARIADALDAHGTLDDTLFADALR